MVEEEESLEGKMSTTASLKKRVMLGQTAKLGRDLMKAREGMMLSPRVVTIQCKGRVSEEEGVLLRGKAEDRTVFLFMTAFGSLADLAVHADTAMEKVGALGVIAATARNTFSDDELVAFGQSPIQALFLTHQPLVGWHDKMVVL